jgi:phospholipid transport system substrate-binding protein
MTLYRGLPRGPILAFVVLAGLLLSLPARAAGPQADAAADFVRELSATAVERLADPERDDARRRAAFTRLLERHFAVEDISRFVLARYWRVADSDTRTAFRTAFKEMLTQRFLPMFRDYDTGDVRVTGARKDPSGDDLYRVETEVARPQSGKTVAVVWRLRAADGGFQVVDVVAEQVSMAITLRSEFTSVIQRNGGQVQALVERMQRKLAKGAYAPDGSRAPS